jgi:hypothetical protein
VSLHEALLDKPAVAPGKRNSMQSSGIPIIALAVSVVATLLSSFSLVLHWKITDVTQGHSK